MGVGYKKCLLGIWCVGVLSCLNAYIFAAVPGYIRGDVYDMSNTPLSGVEIRFYDENWRCLWSSSTRTDPDGTYVSGPLQPGMYYIRAVSIYPLPYIAEYWFDTPDRELAVPVEVTEGCNVYGIDFILEKGGYIRGAIRSAENDPLERVDLDLYTREWSWLAAMTCRSDSDGTYILGPIPKGIYFIRADPDPEQQCVQQYWPGAYYREDAQVLSIHPGDDIEGIDFSLPPAGSVSGAVFVETGRPLSKCRIRVFDYLWREQPVHQVFSGENGDYLAFGIPEGCFYFQADPIHGAGCTDQYYPDTSQRPFARCVYVIPGTKTEGIDFHLLQGNFDIEISLSLSESVFRAGDIFSLVLSIEHQGPELKGIPVFVLLDILDSYYFWPSWTQNADYKAIDIIDGVQSIWIIEPFKWPETDMILNDAWFHAAAVNWSLTDLAGNVVSVPWRCE